MTDDLERRRGLTFSQAGGYAELPRPLALEEMPHAFRNQVWAVIYASMDQSSSNCYVGDQSILVNYWENIAIVLWVGHFDLPVDEFSPDMGGIIAKFKPAILDSKHPFNKVFDFLTALVRHRKCPSELPKGIKLLLKKHQMAYYLDTSGTPTFVPQSSPQDGEMVCGAMSVLADSGMGGAHTHLLAAAEAINRGQYADSMRESIHAVESVVKVIDGDAGKTLEAAINELQNRGLLSHKALAEAFKKLYAYTNDEKGIRHALLNKDTANVGQEEALFMLGTCASFCGYLCRKKTKMG